MFYSKIWLLLGAITSACACPLKGCEYFQEDKLLTCMNVITTINRVRQEVLALQVCEYGEEKLNFTWLFDHFPNVVNITINGGNISSVIWKEDDENALQVLELHNTSINYFRIPPVLKHLRVLNLKGHNLKYYNASLDCCPYAKVYLQGNNFNCSLNLKWVLDLNVAAVPDLNNLTCNGGSYPGKPLAQVAVFVEELKKQCPKQCNCSIDEIIRDIYTEQLKPRILVNCSSRGLTKLPEVLPNGTTYLHLDENSIEDLSPLKTNPYYRTVEDLYLEDNRVRSVEGLEGSHWFNNFRVLKLSGNELSQLPTYALDNALTFNPNMPKAVRLYLGGNPWRCDCVYTPNFQEVLQKYSEQIPDVDDVKCSYLEGDENSLLPILTLSRNSVCRPSTEYSVQALDLLNVVLASLIVLILGKLAYDYYHFKRTGKLPWIVMKMP